MYETLAERAGYQQGSLHTRMIHVLKKQAQRTEMEEIQRRDTQMGMEEESKRKAHIYLAMRKMTVYLPP